MRQQTMPDVQHLLLAALAIFALITSSGYAAIFNVPADQATVQGAVNAASNDDTILVAPGTYFENINFNHKRLFLTSHFLLSKDPRYIALTILNGSTPAFADSASVIRIAGDNDFSSVVQGFTITGGKGTKWITPGFPGQPATLGGGILVDSASPTIQYNIIINNEAMVEVSALSAGGGAIRSGFGNPVIRNNLILNNSGRYGGGIVLNFPTGATIENNVIAGNKAFVSFGGGAMWLGFDVGISVVNNTIVNNTSGQLSGGIEVIGNGLMVRNTILWGNSGTQITAGGSNVRYCDIQGGYTGIGNINLNPQLFGSFKYLESTSPCINAGDAGSQYNDIENPSATGSALWPSFGTLRNDMGAYGGPGAFSFEQVVGYLKNNGIGGVPCTTTAYGFTNLTGTILAWDFSEGTPDSNLTATHIYSSWGVHPLALTGDTGLGSPSSLFVDTAYAIADSLIADTIAAMAGQPVAVEVYARNAPPLYNMIIPIEWSGDLSLQYDSVSKVGCRTDPFVVIAYNNFDLGSNRITVRLQNTVSGIGPELFADTGVVLRYWFTVPMTATTGQTASISLSGYGSYQPQFKTTQPYGTSTLTYTPSTRQGLITASSCCIARGDANYDSQHKRNVLDITFLVAFLFQGGATPPCYSSADTNGDTMVNVVDLTSLVQFLFNNGAAPPACL